MLFRSTQKKRKVKVRREFREEWKTKYKWLREAKHEGKTIMKCIYCETHKATGLRGIDTGCSTLQHDSLVVHASSSSHKLSQAKWIYGNERKAKPITKHISCIDDKNKERVITTMKLVYWMVQEDLPFSKYESLCLLTMSLQTLNMPKNKDYTSYINHMAAKESIFAISEYLEELQISRMLDSLFFTDARWKYRS